MWNGRSQTNWSFDFCSWTTQNTRAQRLLWQKKRESEGPQMTLMASSQKWHVWIPPTTHWPHSVIFSTSGEFRKYSLPCAPERKVYGYSVLSHYTDIVKKNTGFVVVSTWLYILWHFPTMKSLKVLLFSHKIEGLNFIWITFLASFRPKFYFVFKLNV